MTARWITADVFDGLATLDDGTVDLVITSPPFLALRSYLPADHPDKGKEIGSEPTPAAFIDVMLAVTAELRRVLAPHGSICIELGDTYAGSGGAGGDYNDNGLREGQPKFKQRQSAPGGGNGVRFTIDGGGGPGWPLAKSKTLIPELYRLALAYGINPLTGQESPAGRWRVRNVVTWCRPNPPVGALGDKWRPATSDIVIACTSDKRYWDDIATRKPMNDHSLKYWHGSAKTKATPEMAGHIWGDQKQEPPNPAGAPLLDYWELPPGGYHGSHYAVYPPALVEPLIKAMAPPRVCIQCGQPSRRILGEPTYERNGKPVERNEWVSGISEGKGAHSYKPDRETTRVAPTLGWTECDCNPCATCNSTGVEPQIGGTCPACHGKGHHWRPAHVLDPFAGSGTTLAVATGHGHEATGIDLDERNRDLAYERIGPFLFHEEEATA